MQGEKSWWLNIWDVVSPVVTLLRWPPLTPLIISLPISVSEHTCTYHMCHAHTHITYPASHTHTSHSVLVISPSSYRHVLRDRTIVYKLISDCLDTMKA